MAITVLVMGLILRPVYAAAQEQPTDPALGEITIYGSVQLETEKPRVHSYGIFKNHAVCGVDLREVPVVRNNGKALLDTVVFIENAPNNKPFPAAAQKVTINQHNCYFEPYLSVIASGGELEIINSDPVLHNIHAYAMIDEGKRSIINVSQPQRGDITQHTINDDGMALQLTCDAHDFMHGFVFIAKTPYYAVVDDEGNYRISGLPPGTYTVTVWHGVLGMKSETVTVSASTLTHVSFSY